MQKLAGGTFEAGAQTSEGEVPPGWKLCLSAHTRCGWIQTMEKGVLLCWEARGMPLGLQGLETRIQLPTLGRNCLSWAEEALLG